jgi:hypothetical protein
MSLRNRLRQEDRRLLGLLGALVLSLCLDAAVRLWPRTSLDDEPTQPASEPRLASTRPSSEELAALLALLLPPEADPLSAGDTRPSAEPPVVEKEQEGLLAELFINQHRFRLRACFKRSGEPAFAAIERIDADSGARSFDRIRAKDTLGPYTVNSINQRSLKLAAPDGRTIELQLFKLDPQPRVG